VPRHAVIPGSSAAYGFGAAWPWPSSSERRRDLSTRRSSPHRGSLGRSVSRRPISCLSSRRRRDQRHRRGQGDPGSGPERRGWPVGRSAEASTDPTCRRRSTRPRSKGLFAGVSSRAPIQIDKTPTGPLRGRRDERPRHPLRPKLEAPDAVEDLKKASRRERPPDLNRRPPTAFCSSPDSAAMDADPLPPPRGGPLGSPPAKRRPSQPSTETLTAAPLNSKGRGKIQTSSKCLNIHGASG
jgi:hypothetical protein